MNSAQTPAPGYFKSEDCNLDEFKELTSQNVDPTVFKYATEVVGNIPIYDVSTLQSIFEDGDTRLGLMSEWAWVLRHSSGAIALANACHDLEAIDSASEIFKEIIAEEKRLNGNKADHFAKKGLNDRIWNTQQKLCEKSPDVYARYYANPAIDAICESWLGPGYQMTAQINVVFPGGAAQQAHRDYHLGFQSSDRSGQYPVHAHLLSPALTLQGAIAHVDIPVESGSTKLLPFSQSFAPGYMAWRRDDFRDWFEGNYVQLPLKKGDALFFNPALFHAAGDNRTTDVNRMVNLLQISSAFGRAMENVDRVKMSRLLYPSLLQSLATNRFTRQELEAIVASAAEGYSFPSNLDLDPPSAGLAPETQQELLHRALNDNWTAPGFEAELDKQHARKNC